MSLSRAHWICARRSSHSGSRPPISRCGSSSQQRPDRRAECLKILELDQPITIADQLRLETMEVRVAAVLVELEMAGRVKCDSTEPTSIAVNPQRDLLRHCAARQQRRGPRAEKPRDAAFKRRHELALAIAVRPGVRRDRRCRRPQQVRSRSRTALTKPPLTPPHNLAPITLRHQPSLTANELSRAPAGGRLSP